MYSRVQLLIILVPLFVAAPRRPKVTILSPPSMLPSGHPDILHSTTIHRPPCTDVLDSADSPRSNVIGTERRPFLHLGLPGSLVPLTLLHRPLKRRPHRNGADKQSRLIRAV